MTYVLNMLVSSCLAVSAAWIEGGANASPAADDAQILIEIHVFDQWPNHPKLKFNIGQRQVNTPTESSPPPDPPVAAHRMNVDEFTAFLGHVREAQGERDPFLAAVRILVKSGQTASIRIGADDKNGTPIDGMHAVAKPDLRADGKIEVAFSYEAFGLEVRGLASQFENGDQISIRNRHLTLSPGETQFMVATGTIGAPMHLVAVTARVLGAND